MHQCTHVIRFQHGFKCEEKHKVNFQTCFAPNLWLNVLQICFDVYLTQLKQPRELGRASPISLPRAFPNKVVGCPVIYPPLIDL